MGSFWHSCIDQNLTCFALDLETARKKAPDLVSKCCVSPLLPFIQQVHWMSGWRHQTWRTSCTAPRRTCSSSSGNTPTPSRGCMLRFGDYSSTAQVMWPKPPLHPSSFPLFCSGRLCSCPLLLSNVSPLFMLSPHCFILERPVPFDSSIWGLGLSPQRALCVYLSASLWYASKPGFPGKTLS